MADAHLGRREGRGLEGDWQVLVVSPDKGCISWESQLQWKLGGVNLILQILLISTNELTGAWEKSPYKEEYKTQER